MESEKPEIKSKRASKRDRTLILHCIATAIVLYTYQCIGRYVIPTMYIVQCTSLCLALIQKEVEWMEMEPKLKAEIRHYFLKSCHKNVNIDSKIEVRILWFPKSLIAKHGFTNTH